MKMPIERWIAVALVLVTLPLSACQGSSEQAVARMDEPAKVEPVPGTGLSRVTLTAKAAERLGIETAPVEDAGGETLIPYSALVYDPSGETWTYTSPETLTFVRQPVAVARITKDRVFLSDGPPVGTLVVTVGAAELYGAELGIE